MFIIIQLKQINDMSIKALAITGMTAAAAGTSAYLAGCFDSGVPSETLCSRAIQSTISH